MESSNILYEDNHIIAINKANGELVQADIPCADSLEEVVKMFIKVRDKKPSDAFLGVVHRLDRPVSGVVIFAKTSKALSRLNTMFRLGQMHKIYHAVVQNRPPYDEDLLTHYLVRNERQNKSYAHSAPVPGSKESHLRYRVVAASSSFFLLEVELLTGRHHQIRSQLTKIGCPIRGDLKYGYPRSNPNGGISLHARSINFIHPVSKAEITIVAPYPNDDVWKHFTQW
ncbi:MAG: RluA family pseudouridine synthase [Prevotellaceae bacterium]|jgi:23S rRNA pseudouridine1911/1915/1917 synthase|nr:RluA family pseudouridine synthase [Prevotellaceae bacterium]